MSIRKEFEIWAESRGLDLYCSRKDLYEDTETLWAWSAWKASREVLVVELPTTKDNGTLTSGVVLGVLHVVKCKLNDAGVKTK